MDAANTPAYYVITTNKAAKSFILQTPGAFDADA
jgi:hypothetical protein